MNTEKVNDKTKFQEFMLFFNENKYVNYVLLWINVN